ncbi:uncharacterized protein LOC110974996 [Acanthaster planci]|uniref:Uncharacterized protein LOC110974996 n=1 Tax=Acanthaster planci TaxID=133434 RepID=A0A8B7XRW6_ACAPL|nr:uncharacterized protein LOC110974996 [Acanthaster planci]
MKWLVVFPLVSSLLAIAAIAVGICVSSGALFIQPRALSGIVYVSIALVLVSKVLHENMLRLFALTRSNSKTRSKIHCLNMFSALIGLVGLLSVTVAYATPNPVFGMTKSSLQTAMEILGCVSAALYCAVQAHLSKVVRPELCSRCVVNLRRTLTVFVTLQAVTVIVLGNILPLVLPVTLSNLHLLRLSRLSDGILKYVLVSVVCVYLLTFTHEFSKEPPNPNDRSSSKNAVEPEPMPNPDT